MAAPEKLRVLYLGTGAPHAASTGMDVVTRVHIDELLTDPSIDMTGLVVASRMDFPDTPSTLGTIKGVTIVVGDPIADQSRLALGTRKAVYAIMGDGAMAAFSFRSSSARCFVRKALSSGCYDVVIVEQFITVANIKLRDLRRCRAPVLFIAHDVTSTQIEQAGRRQRHFYKRFLFGLETWKAAYYERMIQKLASRTVFLSDYDCRHYAGVAARKTTLLPAMPIRDRPLPQRPTERILLFTGSPSFAPNAIAINWLIRSFAPALGAADPSIKIVLAGKGTDHLTVVTDNVVRLGFVSDERLLQLIDSSMAVICPVMHGSGIKIKILEALARGCLVFATDVALRGLEQFAIEPIISTADSAGSVDRVVAYANDATWLMSQRARLASLWQSHCERVEGQLAAIVHEIGRRA